MPTIATIVEDHGEVDAVPILLRRIAKRVTPGVGVQLPPPIRVKRNQALKANELERAVELAARQAGEDGRILILLDADSDCPGQLAPEVLRRAVIDTDILTDYLAGGEAARDDLTRHVGGLLITRNTKDFPPDDPGVRVPYTITGGDFS